MRILVSTAPLPGHLDWGGLLPTAVSLRAAGHEVLWATGPAVASILAGSGIERADVPIAFSPPGPDAVRPPFTTFEEYYESEVRTTLDVWLRVEDAATAIDAHRALIREWRPDVVVADPMILPAALAAEAERKPLASCGYPGPFATVRSIAATQAVIAELRSRVSELRRHAGLAPAAEQPEPPLFYVAPALHLVYFTADWFARYNPMPSPGAAYVGGCAGPAADPPPWIVDLPAHKPVVLITRSTIYGLPRSGVPDIVDAVRENGGFALVAGQPQAGDDAADVRHEEWVPLDTVLPRVSAIVHHGGMGTTHASIRHAVPQLVTPAVADQFLHAERVASHHAGIAIAPARLSKKTLVEAIRKLVREQEWRAAAAKLRDDFAALGGIQRAAELIVQLGAAT